MFQKTKNVFELKKLTIFAILVLVILGSALPQYASAWKWSYLIPGYGQYLAVKDAVSATGRAISKVGTSVGEALLKAVLYAAGYIMIIVTGTFAEISAWILRWVVGGGIVSVSYTGSDNVMVTAGWRVVRDLANMFVVLGFVIVGIATTLRIREYQAHKTLVPLIIAAILINFSPMICGMIIDGSNILMDHFLKSGAAMAKSFGDSLTKQLGDFKGAWDQGAIAILGLAAGFSFVNIIMFFILLIFSFLFIIRYVALWSLVILSPLAFVCYVFNFTKKYFNMWWDSFLKWCLVGIPAAFFLWLADMMVSSELITSPGEGAYVPLFAYLLPGFMLIVGLLVSLQTGSAGASVIRQGVRAVSRGGKAVARKGGAWARQTKTGRAVEKRGTRVAERLRLTRPGTFEQQQAKARESAVKRMEAIQDSDRLHRIVQKRRGMERGAALETLRKRKELQSGEFSKYRQELDSLGFKTSEFEKVRPDEAKPRTDETQFDATKRVVQGMSSADFRKNVQRESYTPQVFAAMTTQQIKTIGKSGPKLNRDKLIDLAKGSRQQDLQDFANKLAGDPERVKEWKQLVNNWEEVKSRNSDFR